MNNEKWNPSPVFPNSYLVSRSGEVFSIRRQIILKPTTDNKGYHHYSLSENGVRIHAKAHRLIALAFVPNPEGKPQIDHIDGDKTNNAADNLRWVTNKENSRNPATLPRLQEHARSLHNALQEWSKKNAYGSKPVILRWSDGREERYPSVKKSAEAAGINASYMVDILRGRMPQKKTFTARYA